MGHKLLRLKKNDILRNMCSETSFLTDQLIQPIFVSEKSISKKVIPGIPDNYVLNLDNAITQIKSDLTSSCRNFILFLVPSDKKDFDFDLTFHKKVIATLKKILKMKFFYGLMFVYVHLLHMGIVVYLIKKIILTSIILFHLSLKLRLRMLMLESMEFLLVI